MSHIENERNERANVDDSLCGGAVSANPESAHEILSTFVSKIADECIMCLGDNKYFKIFCIYYS